jgi:hypothetical protein
VLLKTCKSSECLFDMAGNTWRSSTFVYGPKRASSLLYFSAPERASASLSAFSFYCLVRDNTRLDRKTTATTKRRQQTTNTHKMHSVQLVLPLCRSVPWTLLGGSLAYSLSSSSTCLYLISAALSLATCSARSLNLTCSKCQGPTLLGGIGIGDRGKGVESRRNRGGNGENDSEERKGRFQIVRVAQCELNGLRKGGGALGQLFFEPSPA